LIEKLDVPRGTSGTLCELPSGPIDAHRGLARLRIAVRGACDFSWISGLVKDQQQQALANADHGKAACATLLPKPDLSKPRQP